MFDWFSFLTLLLIFFPVCFINICILSHKHISVNPLGSGFTPPDAKISRKITEFLCLKNKEDQELHAGS